MGGRIRTIKPQLLENPRTARLSDRAWRLFVSMLLLADDYGNLHADPDMLSAAVFWGVGRSNCAAALTELDLQGLISNYSANGQAFISITGWTEHQRIDHPGKPKVPKPNESHKFLGIIPESLAKVPESLAPDWDLKGLDLDRKGIGSEGSGEGIPPIVPQGGPVPLSLVQQPSVPQKPTDPERPDAPAKTTGPQRPSKPRKGKQAMSAETRVVAAALLAELNTARARSITDARTLSPTDENLRHIAERLAAGATDDDVRHVIAVCAAEAHRDPSTAQWFNAVSPFRPDNFARKLGGLTTVKAPVPAALAAQPFMRPVGNTAIPIGQGGRVKL